MYLQHSSDQRSACTFRFHTNFSIICYFPFKLISRKDTAVVWAIRFMLSILALCFDFQSRNYSFSVASAKRENQAKRCSTFSSPGRSRRTFVHFTRFFLKNSELKAYCLYLRLLLEALYSSEANSICFSYCLLGVFPCQLNQSKTFLASISARTFLKRSFVRLCKFLKFIKMLNYNNSIKRQSVSESVT